MSDLKLRLQEDMKNAMRAQEKQRLGAIRLILAAIKQQEVDKQKEVTDQDIHAILDKMAKQRRESIQQYQEANRQDLVAQEQFELEVIQAYLPQALSSSEVDQLIETAIQETVAQGIKDMGKVMAHLKPLIQGRADASKVSQKVKERLSA